MKKKIHLLGLFLILLALAFVTTLNKTESFANLKPGAYPKSVDEPLLHGDYPVKQNPKVANLGSQEIYQDYPVFSSDSEQSNNIEYWETPDNGKCAPACLCGALYDKKIIPQHPEPHAPQWGSGIRVNYYDSESFSCS
jgi:hypothetical protein